MYSDEFEVTGGGSAIRGDIPRGLRPPLQTDHGRDTHTWPRQSQYHYGGRELKISHQGNIFSCISGRY